MIRDRVKSVSENIRCALGRKQFSAQARRYWKYLKYIAVPAALFSAFALVYRALDLFAMGAIADWFDRMFLYNSTYMNGGELVYYRDISWGAIKSFVFTAGAITVLLLSWAAIVISDIRADRIRRRHSRGIADYLRRFILNSEPLPLELPNEDAEIFTMISEIRLELGKQQAIAREESKRKDDLVTYLAHDIKTPLTSVIGYLSLLSDENDLPAEQRQRFTDIAFRKAGRLEELTDELLEITRFSISRVELKTEEVNLSLMLGQMASEFEPLLGEKSLTIKTDIEPGIRYVCDTDKLGRVIDNLIRNAINYSYPDSEIRISLTADDDAVRMGFENSGRTVPKEALERIFEQFYRADPSRSSATGGSGLGLAIARQLVESHGGSITAESENGLIRFEVTLPVRKS